MRWIFYVNNGGEHYAELTYDWDKDKYHLNMLDNFEEHKKEAPIVMEFFFDQGQTELDDYWCRRMIRERVVPANRQNIGMFLREMQVPFYHECFMMKAMPTCVMDDARFDFIEEIK